MVGLRVVVVASLASVLAVGACSGAGGDDDAAQPGDGVALIGEDIGESRLVGLGPDAEVVDLPALRGRPVVVNFFASTCAPCVREMPALEAVHEQLGDSVAFVGVAVNDRVADALRLVEETGVTYALAADPSGELFAASGFTFLPATVVLDADGEVVHRLVGELEGDELRDALADVGVEA